MNLVLIRGLAFLLGFGGILVSLTGTLMVAKAYYPQGSAWNFLRHMILIAGKVILTGNVQGGLDTIKDAADLARLNVENRAHALLGLFVVVLGFALQAGGFILSFLTSS